jgi:hypothetical protein
MPTIAPENATPGIKDLTNRLNEGYAYSYNVFMRDSGTKDIRDKQAHPRDRGTCRRRR